MLAKRVRMYGSPELERRSMNSLKSICQFSIYTAAAPIFLPLRETANSAVSIILINGIGPVLTVLVVLTGLPDARNLVKPIPIPPVPLAIHIVSRTALAIDSISSSTFSKKQLLSCGNEPPALTRVEPPGTYSRLLM